MKEKQDVERAQDTVAAYQQRLEEMEKEFKAETDKLTSKTDPNLEELQRIMLRPAKKDITVKLVALAWLPYWQMPDRSTFPAWQ